MVEAALGGEAGDDEKAALERKVKKLGFQLDDIGKLKARQDAGEVLQSNQLTKLAKGAAVREQLTQARVGLEATLPALRRRFLDTS